MKYARFYFNRRVIGALLLALALTQCRTPTALTQSSSTNTDSSANSQQNSQQVREEQLHQQQDLEQVSVEFFPVNDPTTPLRALRSRAEKRSDTASLDTSNDIAPLRGQSAPAIKRITHTRLVSRAEQEVQQSTQTQATTQAQTIQNENRSAECTPVPDPYRWRYLFYSLLVVAVGVLGWRLRR